MEKTIVYLDEMEAGVRQALKKVEWSERRRVTERIFWLTDMLDEIQRLPLVARLQLYEAAFYVFNFLRRNRQLGRRVGRFDDEVRHEIERVLNKVYNENYLDNGEGED